jgi:hypothetical protein
MEWNLANIRAAEGRRTEALRDLRLLQDSLRPGQTAVVPDPMYTAMIYARLGDKEEALKCIEKGYAQRSDTFLLLNVTREFDILRDDPRFIEFLHKGGFVE